MSSSDASAAELTSLFPFPVLNSSLPLRALLLLLLSFYFFYFILKLFYSLSIFAEATWERASLRSESGTVSSVTVPGSVTPRFPSWLRRRRRRRGKKIKAEGEKIHQRSYLQKFWAFRSWRGCVQGKRGFKKTSTSLSRGARRRKTAFSRVSFHRQRHCFLLFLLNKHSQLSPSLHPNKRKQDLDTVCTCISSSNLINIILF